MWREWLSKILPPASVEAAPLRAPEDSVRERVGEAEEGAREPDPS
jgi:hypothetical protein